MMDTGLYLGPAIVREIDRDGRRVRVAGGPAPEGWARMALPMDYEPEVGDELLVVGGEELYVIGVLKGKGSLRLRAPGDLSLEAPQGRLSIRAREGLAIESERSAELRAPQVTVRAPLVELVAGRLLLRVRDLYQWVAGLFQSKSARLRVVTEEDALLGAGRLRLRGREDVAVNGKAIHLG